MFVDFNSVFNNEKNSQFIIPKPLVDYMNKSLPIGMKYVIDEDGDCRITSDSGQPITIGGFIFSPTKKHFPSPLNIFFNKHYILINLSVSPLSPFDTV